MKNYTLTEKQLGTLKKTLDSMLEAPGKIETEINDEYHAEGGEGDIELRGTLEVMFGDLGRELKYLIEDVENQPAPIQWVEDVKEFRRLYRLNTPAKTKKEVWTQFKCVREELSELFDEICESDFRPSVKVLDGICDLLFTTVGLALVLDCDIQGAFAEVVRSNLTKLGADGKPIYREDGKVLKGPNFEEPKLKPFLPKEASWNA
ncbi:nucleoside triphosphate pyrophosphohydrolase family protein [Cloacibacillus sp. An23]|uniref:nucleoside triphosphate pyrophosphohydrolase family protein n=1 Tax=Cloacibacillus sp. An23 TaxID=1965591 RepID=UPI000B366B5E|nr:nucleoside triphosphate pyrophosphohydrolase family protein [Cloacibacillus sp. An23]OUO91849.1 hypothetical protein B5F39_11995 [Cloacibacillus sp. An23]